MFQLRGLSLYLPLGVLAFTISTALAQSAPVAWSLGWLLAGMMALYALYSAFRTTEDLTSAHALAEAARTNATRVAPPVNRRGDIR